MIRHLYPHRFAFLCPYGCAHCLRSFWRGVLRRQFNTSLGTDALQSNTTGVNNTAHRVCGAQRTTPRASTTPPPGPMRS